MEWFSNSVSSDSLTCWLTSAICSAPADQPQLLGCPGAADAAVETNPAALLFHSAYRPTVALGGTDGVGALAVGTARALHRCTALCTAAEPGPLEGPAPPCGGQPSLGRLCFG